MHQKEETVCFAIDIPLDLLEKIENLRVKTGESKSRVILNCLQKGADFFTEEGFAVNTLSQSSKEVKQIPKQ